MFGTWKNVFDIHLKQLHISVIITIQNIMWRLQGVHISYLEKFEYFDSFSPPKTEIISINPHSKM
jgi:hypothetical protein